MNALEQNIMEALAGNPRVNPDEISVQATERPSRPGDRR